MTGVTSVGRSVGKYVAWADGERAASAPEFLRATDFDPFTVGIRVGPVARESVSDAVERDRSLDLSGDRLTVTDVVAVERALDRYPDAFERLFPEVSAGVVVERRGGDRLAVEGELVEVSSE
ncbi:hypothetical protein [Halosegnis marinus]|uniref:hypothetical protein n=1 Tax=Halosegnis marinus TaxID=3034023 RepID=UPI0036168A6D